MAPVQRGLESAPRRSLGYNFSPSTSAPGSLTQLSKLQPSYGCTGLGLLAHRSADASTPCPQGSASTHAVSHSPHSTPSPVLALPCIPSGVVLCKANTCPADVGQDLNQCMKPSLPPSTRYQPAPLPHGLCCSPFSSIQASHRRRKHSLSPPGEGTAARC